MKFHHFAGMLCLSLATVCLLPIEAHADRTRCQEMNDHLWSCRFQDVQTVDYAPGEFCDFPVREVAEASDKDVVHLPEGEANGGGHHLSQLQGSLTNPLNGRSVSYHSAANFFVKDQSFDFQDECNGTLSMRFIMTGENLGLKVPGHGLVDAFIGRQEFERIYTVQDCEFVDASSNLVAQAGQWDSNEDDVEIICDYLSGK